MCFKPVHFLFMHLFSKTRGILNMLSSRRPFFFLFQKYSVYFRMLVFTICFKPHPQPQALFFVSNVFQHLCQASSAAAGPLFFPKSKTVVYFRMLVFQHLSHAPSTAAALFPSKAFSAFVASPIHRRRQLFKQIVLAFE